MSIHSILDPVGPPGAHHAEPADSGGDHCHWAPWLLAAGLTILGLLGALLVLYATRWGPWAYSDSVEFIVSARNLVAGRGLGLYAPSGRFMPLQLHPPLFPLLLAGLTALGLDTLDAARWLGAALLGICLVVIGLAAWGVSRSVILSLSVTAMVLLSTRWIDMFSGAMTEPLFIVLAVASLCALVLATRTGGRWWIPVAGALVGLSILTRYPGIAVLGAGLAYLMVLRPGGARHRLTDAGLFLLPALAPLLIWLSVLPSEGGPPLGLQLPSWAEAWRGLAPVRLEIPSYIWAWMPFSESLPGLPHRGRIAAIAVVLGVALGLFAVTALHRRRAGRGGIGSSTAASAFSLLGLFIGAYVAVVALAYISRDVGLDLIDRTLMPISLGLSAAVLCLAWFLADTWGSSRLASWAVAVVGLFIAVRGIAPTLNLATALHEDGRGYTSAGWHDSGVVRGLRELGPELVVVTNEPAAVELWTGRVAHNLLELEAQEDSPGSGLPADAGALALFDSIYGQWLTVSEDETRDRVNRLTQGMTVYSDYWDGTIYLVPGE